MTDQIQTIVASVPSSVTVIAVTKTFPFEIVQRVYKVGLRHFGENRVTEAEEKIFLARQDKMHDIVWHMIGHVQRNKAKEVAQLFDWVDSVDGIDLSRALDREAGTRGKKLHVLLEVNISGESTKSGFDVAGWEKQTSKRDQFLAVVSVVMKLPNIILDGLMTMPPYVMNAENNRRIFQSMKKLSAFIQTQVSNFGSELSMGTSCDYSVAIEEGATQVRLGEALFGKRLVVR